LNDFGKPFDAVQTSYFLGREVMVAAVMPKLSLWRRWLYRLMVRNAAPATEFFARAGTEMMAV
jgi:KUP system potassium uptake protein